MSNGYGDKDTYYLQADPIAAKLGASPVQNLNPLEIEEIRRMLSERAEKTVIEAIEPQKYSRTYTAFSGADIVVIFDNNPYGTIHALSFHDNGPNHYNSLYRIEGTISETMFDEPTLQHLPKNLTMQVKFRNEYGGEYDMEFTGVDIKTRTTSFSMDDIIIENHYTFTAKGIREGKPADLQEKSCGCQ